jgi:hypothetical protein
MPLAAALEELTGGVLGIDLHPVAVALARVTYLLAIGRDRLMEELAALAIRLRDMGTVPSLAGYSGAWRSPRRTGPSSPAASVSCADRTTAGRTTSGAATSATCVRPVCLSRAENRVDTMAGNPPWLSYRHMPGDMQGVFQKVSDNRGPWHETGVSPDAGCFSAGATMFPPFLFYGTGTVPREVRTRSRSSSSFCSIRIRRYVTVSGSATFSTRSPRRVASR